MDLIVIAIYMLSMLGIAWYSKRRARSEEEFLVAGRRLGPFLYAGTMAAIVLGGASTVGGVGLGYQYGISGMWLVFALGIGVLLLSIAFAGRINRLEVFTVSQMLELRYGPGASLVSGIVMAAYTLMLAVTSTIAYGAIFSVLFGLGKVAAILLGGGVVIAYSAIGGMWSITLTDFVQFVIKTIGIFIILLPLLLLKVGGWDGLHTALPATAFEPFHIGRQTIITYFVIYFFGITIGQDIWQRVFTARGETVARYAGAVAGVYCLFYAIAGAVIGMCAQVLLPGIESRDNVYPQVVLRELPPGISGLVMAAALAAIMSTSSGALIATATVTKQDLVARLRSGRINRVEATVSGGSSGEVRASREYILVIGVVVLIISCFLRDVVAALTIAYDILVGGLLVAILGGILWRRGTIVGALASMIFGSVLTLGTMAFMGDIYANLPIFAGLGASLIAYIAGSLLSEPTADNVRREWQRRISRRRNHEVRQTE